MRLLALLKVRPRARAHGEREATNPMELVILELARCGKLRRKVVAIAHPDIEGRVRAQDSAASGQIHWRFASDNKARQRGPIDAPGDDPSALGNRVPRKNRDARRIAAFGHPGIHRGGGVRGSAGLTLALLTLAGQEGFGR